HRRLHSFPTRRSSDLVDAGGGNIALRALANNMYVCAENAGASSLIANRTAVGAWETFTEIDAGNGNSALLAMANNRFVCAENARSEEHTSELQSLAYL